MTRNCRIEYLSCWYNSLHLRVVKRPLLIVVLILHFFPVLGQEPLNVSIEARPGDTMFGLLKRFQLPSSSCMLDQFVALNQLSQNRYLISGGVYKIPITIHNYNEQSIRTTIGIDDYNSARQIADYNQTLWKAGIKPNNYLDDRVLWVPHHIVNCGGNDIIETPKPATAHFPIFGDDWEQVPLEDDLLKGQVFYIVSGHGGPDPGAIGSYQGQNICEDEYAYDISLRLARSLLSHQAMVYLITRDPNDGIRSGAILDCDKDEQSWKEEKIPYKQVKRLSQRAKAINKLYLAHKKSAIKQTLLVLHVDSRSKNERIDMFFYHHPRSKSGKALAQKLKTTVNEKYQKYQKNRGYKGTVGSRNLYMLREPLPTTVYIELGNIRNPKDQKRFVLESNRLAVANWLADGLLSK